MEQVLSFPSVKPGQLYLKLTKDGRCFPEKELYELIQRRYYGEDVSLGSPDVEQAMMFEEVQKTDNPISLFFSSNILSSGFIVSSTLESLLEDVDDYSFRSWTLLKDTSGSLWAALILS